MSNIDYTQIITVQTFLNQELIEEKMDVIINIPDEIIKLQVEDTKLIDDEGKILYILKDGHHTYAAARELGFKIEFEIIKDSNLEGDELILSYIHDRSMVFLKSEVIYLDYLYKCSQDFKKKGKSSPWDISFLERYPDNIANFME